MSTAEFSRRTTKTFIEEAPGFPENAVLFPDKVLKEIVHGRATDGNPIPTTEESIRVAKAELAVRYFLSPVRYKGSDVMDLLCAWFGSNTLAEFICQCEKCCLCTRPQAMIERTLATLSAAGSRLSDVDVSLIRKVFRPWLEADGVIPVFNDSGASILPFSFVGEGVAEPCVVDSSETTIFPEWTKWLRGIMDVVITSNVKVNIHANNYVRDTGSSMMLPVAMAWLRKADRLPRYNPIRFASTGSLVGGVLGEVSTKEKLAKIDQDIKDGVLVRPGNGLESFTIPTGLRIGRVSEFLKEMAEPIYACSASYACRRLEELDGKVRGGHVGTWEPLIGRLDRLWGALDPDIDIEEYLHGLMLRSAARCHAGDTREAAKLNKQASEIARSDSGFTAQLLRLEIEELVLLQDEEDFEKIFALSPTLGSRIEKFAIDERESDAAVDLQMRYYGTMGQFEAYAALSGFRGLSKESSKRHFDEAFNLSVELAQRARKRIGCNDNKDGEMAIYNCGQDANYLLLWEALFGSVEGLCTAAAKARRYADNSREEGFLDKADKNDVFRRRFEALGLYMSVLRGEVPRELEEEDEMRHLAGGSGDWIPATTGKYLGAVATARGDEEEGKRFFEAAIEKLDGKESSLFRCFRMTIFAEAYRSLRRHPEYSQYAESMRKKALAAFDLDAGSAEWKKEDWRVWLADEGDDASFPGLKYWY